MGKSESIWQRLVSDYTSRDLSNSLDKLPALSGIATKFHEALPGKYGYCAGLWREFFPGCLGWCLPAPQKSKPVDYPAPSWSWASVFGEIEWLWWEPPDDSIAAMSGDVTQCVVLSCIVIPENNDAPFGRVKHGILRVRGTFRTIQWDGAERIPWSSIYSTENAELSNSTSNYTNDHEGTAALAMPDITEETLYTPGPEPLDEVTFFMGRGQEDVNKIRRQVTCLAIGGFSALMLQAGKDDCYVRLGSIHFFKAEDYQRYFTECEMGEFTIE